MKKLDDLVITHLVERLFHLDRLMGILASVSARRAQKAREIDRRVSTLRTQVS